MPKGQHHGPDIEFELAGLCGAIKERIILFSAETGASANWTAARLSAFLSPQGQGLLDHLPAVRQETTGGRGAVEPLALADHAHSSPARPTIDAEPKPSKVNPYWQGMTPEQRSKEIARRRSKWSKKALAKWSGGKPAKGNLTAAKKKRLEKDRLRKQRERAEAKTTRSNRDMSKQRIYVARHNARLQGKPLPPLPDEKVAKKKSGKTNVFGDVFVAPKVAAKKPWTPPPQKQSIYQARSQARKNGKPLPPLPPKSVRKPKPKSNSKISPELQAVYAARSRARIDGTPLPPLPSETQTPPQPDQGQAA